MPTNVIVYPNGLAGGNTNPHTVFEDGLMVLLLYHRRPILILQHSVQR